MAMSADFHPLPLVVLAGSDERPAALPEGSGQHAIQGKKGVEVQVEGRPLIDHVLERMLGSGHFAPAYIAGPKTVYGENREGAQVIDTDRSLGANVRTVLEAMAEIHPGKPLAITTYDIIPDLDELDALMADYRAHVPMDFWYPLVLAADEELGESAWKPKYTLRPSEAEASRAVLPSHLMIVDAAVFRLPLVYRAFDLLYRTRNRSVMYRLFYGTMHLAGFLIGQDLRHLARLRPPVATLPTLWQSIRLALRLRGGEMTTEELADRIRAILIRWRHRKAHPERRGRIPLVNALSFAKDIDTFEEAEEQRRLFKLRRTRAATAKLRARFRQNPPADPRTRG